MFSQYKERVRKTLSEKRYHHSLAVAEQCKNLAPIFGADPTLAELAGLLHDICKETSYSRQLQYLNDRDILLNIQIIDNPPVWHGITASVMLKEEWEIEQLEVLSAIALHTTGGAHMTPLEETLFVADFTSKDRRYPEADDIRKMVSKQPMNAVLEGFVFGLKQAIKHRRMLIPQTVEGYHAYLKKREKVLSDQGQEERTDSIS